MKAVILILANDDNLYPLCQSLWKSYMNLIPNIKSYFIKYDTNLQENISIKEDTIFVKGTESLIPGCLDKTIKSIKFLLDTGHDFDFLLRTNMSSVINLYKFSDFVNTFNYDIGGVIGDYFGKPYISGAGILMNRKTCDFLVNNSLMLNYCIIDDVSIGHFLSEHIKLTQISRKDITELNFNNIPDDILSDTYHFRCKSLMPDYKNTLTYMKKMISLIYDKDVIRNMFLNEINQTYNLISNSKYPNKNSDDIVEHLPTLYNYAKTCDSVFETGVRGVVSLWAFLKGLKDNLSSNKKYMLLNDIDACEIDDLANAARNVEIDVEYIWKNNLEIELKRTYDIVFIDTWHVYGQLKRELNKFSEFANKYIIMHDTTVDERYGETIRLGWNAAEQSRITGIPIEEINKGLWPAIEEFLEKNNDWYLKERFYNNNGLTILAKKNIV